MSRSKIQSDSPTALTVVYLLQAMKLAVSRGAENWTHGLVRPDRINDLHAKLRIKFGVNPTDAEQLAQRRNGQPRCRLFFRSPKEFDKHTDWWLLSSGPLEGETMKNAADRKHRLTVGHFELVRLTRLGNGACWTWRCQPEAWTRFEERGLHLARQRDLREARGFLEQLSKWPGESGLRQQRLELFRSMSKFSGGKLEVPFLPYARFLRNKAETSDLPPEAPALLVAESDTV